MTGEVSEKNGQVKKPKPQRGWGMTAPEKKKSVRLNLSNGRRTDGRQERAGKRELRLRWHIRGIQGALVRKLKHRC